MNDFIFDKNKRDLFGILKDFSFPRLTGSKGEKKAQIYLSNQIKKLNYIPIIEDFNYSNKKMKEKKLLVLIFCVTMIINLILQLKSYDIIILLVLIVALVTTSYSKLYSQFISNTIETSHSKNIITQHFSSKNKENNVHLAKIILIAHYDSAGFGFHSYNFFQSVFLTKKRILISYILLIIISSIISSNIINEIIFSIIFFITSLILLCFSFINLINCQNNNSDGTSNNSVGCTLLLSIMKRIKDVNQNFDWCDIEFIFTGAKEQGSYGSKAYIKKHQSELDSYKDIYVINFNNLSEKMGYMKPNKRKKEKSTSIFLEDLIMHHLKKSNINSYQIKRDFFENSDHIPFLEKKYNVFSFTSTNFTNINTLFSPLFFTNIYSPSDNFINYDPKILMKVHKLVYDIILTLDKRIDDKINSGE